MNARKPPTANAQLSFLRSLQRIFEEGMFSSSYKFALLHAIADLCLVKGDDNGAELELTTSEIAEQFVRLYWPQVVPLAAGGKRGILSQNKGQQARIVREIAEQRAHYNGSLAKLERNSTDWENVRENVEKTVKKQPLWKLQKVGEAPLNFLYDKVDDGDAIRLKSGIAYCFRAFYPMIVDMIEVAWSRFVQGRNSRLLGQVVDLRSFLFGSQRNSLAKYGPLLSEVQRGRCFYCNDNIKSGGQVDHFIPWRRYALDLGHNFVLAHKRCNSSKSDRLAAEEHLKRWTKRNRSHRDELEIGFNEHNVLHDLPATYQIARWAYGHVHRARGQVWVQDKELRTISDDWRKILNERPDALTPTNG